jgi:hypothetical protein
LAGFKKDIEDVSVWGNAWHIGVASWVFKVTILVFMDAENPQVFGEGEWTWALKFSVNHDGSGGHYDVLKVLAHKEVEVQDEVGDLQRQSKRETVGKEGTEVDKFMDAPKGTHGGVPGVKVQGHWLNADFVVDKLHLDLNTLTKAPKKGKLGRSQNGRATILSVNLGGSREALGWALEQEVDILIVQEHRMIGRTLEGAMKQAQWQGWTGVWEEAETSGKQSRSGGLATLVRAPARGYRMKVGKRRRWHRVLIPWRKGCGLHVFNVYGWTGTGAKELEAMEIMIKDIHDEIGMLGNVP